MHALFRAKRQAIANSFEPFALDRVSSETRADSTGRNWRLRYAGRKSYGYELLNGRGLGPRGGSEQLSCERGVIDVSSKKERRST